MVICANLFSSLFTKNDKNHIFTFSVILKNSAIVFGILNWGLGHATRSLPLIRAAQTCGYSVVIASDGESLKWLQKEVPNAHFEELPGYNIDYSKGFMPWYVKSLPEIAKAATVEKGRAAEICEKYHAVGLISDNRLGFVYSNVPSVYITHQLSVEVPVGKKVASRLHAQYINAFDEVWIPDNLNIRLAGKLTENKAVTIPKKYIGFLSRFNRLERNPKNAVAVLSGPPSAREEWINEILAEEINDLIIVGATEGQEDKVRDIFGLRSTSELETTLINAAVLIARCGYSTLMDAIAMGIPTVVKATPKQYEQLYLENQLEHVPTGVKWEKGQSLREAIDTVLQSEEVLPYNENLDRLFAFFEGKGKG